MKRFIFILPVFFALPVFAQENNPTAGLWQELEVAKSLPYDWKVGVNADLRTMDFVKHINRYSFGVDVSKGVGKYVKFGLHYAFLRKHYLQEVNGPEYELTYDERTGLLEKMKEKTNIDADNYANRHRVSFDVTADKRFWKTLRISLRERYQFTYQEPRDVERVKIRHKYSDPSYDAQGNVISWDEEEHTSEETLDSKPSKYNHMLRSRLKFAIDKKGWFWEPYTSVEFHNNLCNSFHLDKLRVMAGVEFKVTKWCNLSVAYLYNHEKDEDSNLDTHALCLGYNFKF